MIDLLHWMTLLISVAALIGLAVSFYHRWSLPVFRPVVAYGIGVAAAEIVFRVWSQWVNPPAQAGFVLGRGLAIFIQFLLASFLLLWASAIYRFHKVTNGPV